jgi:phage terminase large subunit-like protein
VTGEVVRDTVQKILVGRPGRAGTGAIPKDAIVELVSARGIPELLDTIKVTHVSGGVSITGLKTYASGREKFQGETLDWVWFDEEPPADIYTEGLTRTNVGANPVWMTFTPLQGVSTVVKRFLHENDVEHYRDDEKKKIIA